MNTNYWLLYSKIEKKIWVIKYLSIIYIIHKKKIKIKQYVFTFKIGTIILLV